MRNAGYAYNKKPNMVFEPYLVFQMTLDSVTIFGFGYRNREGKMKVRVIIKLIKSQKTKLQ